MFFFSWKIWESEFLTLLLLFITSSFCLKALRQNLNFHWSKHHNLVGYSHMNQSKYKTVFLVFLYMFDWIAILCVCISVYLKNLINDTLISPEWGSCMLLRAGSEMVCPRLRAADISWSSLLTTDSVLQTFDECVAAGGSDCAPEKLWLQIPFFCGHYSECW